MKGFVCTWVLALSGSMGVFAAPIEPTTTTDMDPMGKVSLVAFHTSNNY